MATKTCPNGHHYDSSIYGDHCPFCPSPNANLHTQVINNEPANNGMKTNVISPSPTPTAPAANGGGHTVIRAVGSTDNANEEIGNAKGDRKVVGLLVSYTHNKLGDVYKIYVGKTFAGRDASNEIVIKDDSEVSGTHLLFLYREAEKVFWANDENSSNGTFINGQFAGEKTALKLYDIIKIGNTELTFIPIPQE